MSASAVKSTELRCITKRDCELAPDLAAYLGLLLGAGPLPVKDLSARYEGRSRARPKHFEIWFGDDPITLSPVAGEPASGGQAANTFRATAASRTPLARRQP